MPVMFSTWQKQKEWGAAESNLSCGWNHWCRSCLKIHPDTSQSRVPSDSEIQFKEQMSETRMYRVQCKKAENSFWRCCFTLVWQFSIDRLWFHSAGWFLESISMVSFPTWPFFSPLILFCLLSLVLAEAETGAALNIAAPQILDGFYSRGSGLGFCVCVCEFGYTTSAVVRIFTPSKV